MGKWFLVITIALVALVVSSSCIPIDTSTSPEPSRPPEGSDVTPALSPTETTPPMVAESPTSAPPTTIFNSESAYKIEVANLSRQEISFLGKGIREVVSHERLKETDFKHKLQLSSLDEMAIKLERASEDDIINIIHQETESQEIIKGLATGLAGEISAWAAGAAAASLLSPPVLIAALFVWPTAEIISEPIKTLTERLTMGSVGSFSLRNFTGSETVIITVVYDRKASEAIIDVGFYPVMLTAPGSQVSNSPSETILMMIPFKRIFWNENAGSTMSVLPEYGGDEIDWAGGRVWVHYKSTPAQVSGDMRWTKVDSPYIITEDVVVPEGATLTIEPGVEIKFEGVTHNLQIDGQLIARGTEHSPIVFSGWPIIKFTNSSIDASYDREGNYIGGSIMQYSTIQFIGRNDTTVLQITESSPFIDHSNIVMPTAQELPLSVRPHRRGIHVQKGSPVITNNRLTNSGISVYNSLLGLHEPIESNVIIRGNIISNNKQRYGAGIHTWDSVVVIEDNIITGNSAYHEHGAGGGIWVQGGTASITGNTISGNSAERGGGIMVESDTAIIGGNSISNNNAKWGGGIWLNTKTVTINGNNIFDNELYDFFSENPRGSTNVDATGNWWGTTDEAVIQQHIYDSIDDPDLGLVAYVPYLTKPLDIP